VEASPSPGAPTGARGLARDGPATCAGGQARGISGGGALRRPWWPGKGRFGGRHELEMAMTRSIGLERERNSGKPVAAKLLLAAMVDAAAPSAEQRAACQGGGGRRFKSSIPPLLCFSADLKVQYLRKNTTKTIYSSFLIFRSG
jgi:hypothetical protein